MAIRFFWCPFRPFRKNTQMHFDEHGVLKITKLFRASQMKKKKKRKTGLPKKKISETEGPRACVVDP